MSAKIMSSVGDDEHKDLSNKIGCMNRIFHLFDRHHFSGRRISNEIPGGQHPYSHLNRQNRHKQQQPELDSATKLEMEKCVEFQEEKPRNSSESSRALFTSSSCSSTLSSLDGSRVQHHTEAAQQQLGIMNFQETPLQQPARKQKQDSSEKTEPHNFRDVIKESMYREPRTVPIKPRAATEERNGIVAKHIDSPRPLHKSGGASSQKSQQSSKTAFEGRIREQLSHPRFSYDGKESHETKTKENPRLSLDSKTSSIRRSHQLDSRLKFLHIENHEETSSQEQLNSNKTSSIVAKLMGLEGFNSIISGYEMKLNQKEDSLSAAERSMKTPEAKSPRVTQNTNQSPTRGSKPNSCSRIRMESAPWRQQSSGMASEKASTAPNTLSSSVYCDIEKRVSKLEFKRSGKDLRALKQILEAMQKTRDDKSDEKSRCYSQEGWSDNDSGSVSNTAGKQHLGSSSIMIMKPAKLMDDIKFCNTMYIPEVQVLHSDRLHARSPKYNIIHSAQNSSKNPRDLDCHLSSTENGTTWQSSKHDRGATKGMMKDENRASSPWESLSPQKMFQRNRRRSSEMSSSESCQFRRDNNSRRLTAKGSPNGKHSSKEMDQQLCQSDMNRQGERTCQKSRSNNITVSQTALEIIQMARSINNISRQNENISSPTQHSPSVETTTMSEQPSPISVLDDAFYREDSPTPVKKLPMHFQANWISDARPICDEVEWHLENPNPSAVCNGSDRVTMHNIWSRNKKDSVQDVNEAACQLPLSPDYTYIKKILLTSGLLNKLSFLPTSDRVLLSGHLINPEMFHVIEQTEEIWEGLSQEVAAENNKVKPSSKLQRKMIFDMVNEILVRMMSSGRFDIMAKKPVTPDCLLREIHSEVDSSCMMKRCDLENGVEPSHLEGWGELTGVIPALVLDVERLVFKDLINEIVTGDVMTLKEAGFPFGIALMPTDALHMILHTCSNTITSLQNIFNIFNCFMGILTA